MPLTIGWDCDETVMPYGHRFWLASLRCAAIISEALGVDSPSAIRILQRHEKVELEVLSERGFALRRFPETWIRTYRVLCSERGRIPQSDVERRIVRTCAPMHDPPYQLYPETKLVLRYCSLRFHRLHLITQGPRKLQEDKLRETGIKHFFASFWFGEDGSKTKGMERMLRSANGDPCVMVGDGRGSDILPAIQLGIHAVWLSEGDPWAIFDAEIDPSLHHTIRSLAELPPILEKIEQAYA